MSHEHDGPGFLIETGASRLDIVVGRHVRNLNGAVRRVEFCCENLGSLPRPQFVTVLDAIESRAALSEMLAYALDGSPAVASQASLGVFGFRLGRSMLHEVNCHGSSPPRVFYVAAELRGCGYREFLTA